MSSTQQTYATKSAEDVFRAAFRALCALAPKDADMSQRLAIAAAAITPSI